MATDTPEIEAIRERRGKIKHNLQAGSANARAFGSPDSHVRVVGKCGQPLHDGCAVATVIKHEGLDADAYKEFFANAPADIDYLLAEVDAAHEALKGLATQTLKDGLCFCDYDEEIQEKYYAKRGQDAGERHSAECQAARDALSAKEQQ